VLKTNYDKTENLSYIPKIFCVLLRNSGQLRIEHPVQFSILLGGQPASREINVQLIGGHAPSLYQRLA
jgi:hypothetical protein